MCQKRGCHAARYSIVADRAVWEKISKGRAGIRWDNNVVEKIWKDSGDQEEVHTTAVHKEVWWVQDGEGKARVEEEGKYYEALRNEAKERRGETLIIYSG